MGKTATLNLRVDPDVKKCAEEVLSQLGVSMATAIDMYLRQIYLTGGIPFPVTLPKAPVGVDTDLISDEDLLENPRDGHDAAEDGKTQDAAAVYDNFRKDQEEI